MRFVGFVLLISKLTGQENKILHCCGESEQGGLTMLFIPNGHWPRTCAAQREAQTVSNDEAIEKILLNVTDLPIYV